MEVSRPYVFQCDADIVKQVYRNNNNYLIEFNEVNKLGNICAIYFSSNDIYYPNNELAFKERIIKKNSYEWFRVRIENAYKHIFIRDIQKQWYLEGINESINSVQKLYEFLREETNGFQIITIGSSAGGYAAVLFGVMLSAEKILSFNGQMMLNDLLETSDEITNPIIFRNSHNASMVKYYSLKEFVKINKSHIFYFCSRKSLWDYNQYLHIKEERVNVLFFNTDHHGIPFLKNALYKVINTDNKLLIKQAFKIHNPILFSIYFAGLKSTMIYVYQLLLSKILKK